MKSVLITYCPASHLERNTIIRIPDDCDIPDISYLKKQCTKFFSFGTNVSLNIIFQRFDPEWESFIDLEEDSIVEHKEKLRLIVIPSLNDSITSATSSMTDHDDLYTNDISFNNTDNSMDDSACYVDRDSNPFKKRRISIESEVNDESTSCDEDKKLVIPQVVKPQKIDEQPLPDPFPLPRHFTSEVELALSSCKMTRETNLAFLSAIASAILSYKRYPTKEEYTRVAMDIIRTYPFMKPPNGSPTGGIVQSLIDRFKQFRRKKKERLPSKSNESSENSSKLKRVPASNIAPPKCSGEDEASFQSHNKVIRAEMKKPRGGNTAIINDLIKRSYSMRRRDILSTPRDISTLLQLYPFLKNLDQIFMEMEYICEKDRLQLTVRDSWSKLLAPKITQLAEREKQSTLRLRTQMDHLPIQESSVYALCILPYLICDKTKPDHEKIVHIAPESCDPQAVIDSKKQTEPFLLVIGNQPNYEPSQIFLIIDQEIICEVKDINDCVLSLLSAFYVFNICYTKGCNNFYCFLEMQLLGINPKRIPASVSHFLSRLT